MVELNISDSKMSDENLAAVSNLTQLEILTMKRCFLKTLPQRYILNSPYISVCLWMFEKFYSFRGAFDEIDVMELLK